MNGFTPWVLLALMLTALPAMAKLGDMEPIDFTKRYSEVADKRFPLKSADLKMNEQFSGRKIPIKRWHAEFNSIGQRRAPLEMRERHEKTIIKPQVLDMKTLNRELAPQNGRMAYVRNFDRVQENKLVPEYRDAEVVTVDEMSVPAVSEEEKTVSMRELNRFSFQRNHSDSEGVDVQRTVSEE